MGTWAPPTTADQVSVGTTPASSNVSVYVPDEYKANENFEVPGLSTPDMGFGAPPNSRALEMGLPPGTTVPGTGTQSTLAQGLSNLLDLGNMDPNALEKVQAALTKAGYLDAKDSSFTAGHVATGDATYDAFANVLNDAIVTGESYTEILKNAGKAGAAAVAAAAGGSTGGGTAITPRSETTSHVELTSAPDAAAIAKNQFESLLGRNVTTKESQAFYGALTAYEQANPATTTDSVGGTSTNENVSETSSGGIGSGGAEELADNDILQHHGAEYAQAQGNQIYNLFSSLIGGG